MPGTGQPLVDADMEQALSILGLEPGTDLPVTFQSGDGTPVEFAVPVVDGALSYYAEFVPGSRNC